MIQVDAYLTELSARDLSFLSEISDKKDYRRKGVIGNLSLKKRYNRIFRLKHCF